MYSSKATADLMGMVKRQRNKPPQTKAVRIILQRPRVRLKDRLWMSRWPARVDDPRNILRLDNAIRLRLRKYNRGIASSTILPRPHRSQYNPCSLGNLLRHNPRPRARNQKGSLGALNEAHICILRDPGRQHHNRMHQPRHGKKCNQGLEIRRTE
ncbi:uncharacterized protein BJX67DRAFT_344944 [Aspergillus lucknowensis]|uniref:Uncharacterized protein n=1 Tax=Aspergillus lucknowensis TaxID=176173 RepID=A0ABR4M2U4_9EURO